MKRRANECQREVGRTEEPQYQYSTRGKACMHIKTVKRKQAEVDLVLTEDCKNMFLRSFTIWQMLKITVSCKCELP